MAGIRRTYKDSVFRRLFGDNSNRDSLLSLYNALNGTNYDDPSDLTINTIDDAVYMGMKNDISCIIDCHMVLIEQQSTYNPNMPLRGLMYFGKLYDQFIKTNSRNIYSSDLIKIPTPRYFIFYNGQEEMADKTILRLSDAFVRPDPSGNFEWSAEMININQGHNESLLESCRILKEYVLFIERVRFYLQGGYDTDDAVNNAVDDCIRGDVLKQFLLKNKSEVIDMCITEYNEAETMQLFLEEGFEKGEKRGLKRGAFNTLADLVNDGIISDEIAAERLNLSLEEFFQKMEEYNNKGQ